METNITQFVCIPSSPTYCRFFNPTLPNRFSPTVIHPIPFSPSFLFSFQHTYKTMRHPVFTAFVCAVCAVLAVPAWATLHSENALSTDVIIPNQHHVSSRTNLLLV